MPAFNITAYEPSMGVQLLAALRAMFAKNRTQITSEQVVQEHSRRSRLAVARISRPRSNHQKPGRGIAERLRDPSCRRSSDQASGCLATRLQGGTIRGRVCAFLATRAEHPNTQAWGRRKDVKVFGCSDDCARCALRRLTVCQLTHESRGNGGG